MKHEEIEGNNTSLINKYIARYFTHIFRVAILYLNLKAKRIILFIMIMLFLPLSLLSDDHDIFVEDEVIWFNKDIDTDGDMKAFYVEISKKDKNIVISSFDDMDGNITAHTKNDNLYNLIYPNGYSSTIELAKKRIEFIEYFLINVEIYKNNELQYKFSSDSNEYYDYRYPNCISQYGDSGFNEGVIKINYNEKMTSRIVNFLKINQWLPFVYRSSQDDDYIENINDHKTDVDGVIKRVVDEVFIRKELCDNDECEVQVMVKEGEEFHVISKINELNSGICATRRAREAGGSEMVIIAPYIDPVDHEIEKLQTANIVFDTPSSMYRNKTYIINLKLDAVKDISDLLKELGGTEKESAVVKYSRRMKAELISENKKAFEITSISPDIQAISSISTTSWKWDVTPLELGEQYLHLSLTAFLDIEGKETALSIKTFDKVIEVNIAYPDEITLFMQNNWKWILGSLLFPLVGFWWKNNRKKEEE